MRLFPLLLATLALAGAPVQGQQMDDGFDDRGVDRHERTPDWNYRHAEPAWKGAYYDGGRYGPGGLLRERTALDPWLAGTDYAALAPDKANRGFRKLADRNRDSKITDAEIFAALKRLTP